MRTTLIFPYWGGVDRDFFPSEFKLDTWLFQIFPPFIAYLVKLSLAVLLSVIGWLLVVQQMPGVFKLEKKSDINFMVLCGFLYGLMPKAPLYAIAFASLPLLLALLCSTYKRPIWWKYLLLFLFPIISDFTYFGIFICGYIVLFIIGDTIVKRRMQVPLLGALLVLAAGYIVTDYRLFYLMVVERIPTLRSVLKFGDISFVDALHKTIGGFKNGHLHSGTSQRYFIVWVCGAYFFWNNGRYLWKKRFKDMIADPFNLLVVWAAFNAFLHGFENYEPFREFIFAIFPPLRGWRCSRALWFNPLLWVWMFSLVLLRVLHAERNYLLKKPRLGTALLLLGSFAVIFFHYDAYSEGEYNDIYWNIRNTWRELTHQEVVTPTWENFYAEDLFEQIKKDIGYDGEWSIAFGFHPPVLPWNGIATLDGYHPYYALSYKEKFAQLTKPLLEESEYYRDYFMGWGGRAYVYSPKGTFIVTRGVKTLPEDLPIDADVFRQMEGKYVFSALPIKNMDQLGLEYLGHWTDENALYEIFIYQTAET